MTDKKFSYLSRQVLGKVARVRHMVAGAGQHVRGRMVADRRAKREKARLLQVPDSGDGVGELHAPGPWLLRLLSPWGGAGPSVADQ